MITKIYFTFCCLIANVHQGRLQDPEEIDLLVQLLPAGPPGGGPPGPPGAGPLSDPTNPGPDSGSGSPDTEDGAPEPGPAAAGLRNLDTSKKSGAWRMGFTSHKLYTGSGPYRAGDGASWEGLKSCGDNKAFGDYISLKVTPNPLKIVEGEEIEIHFHFKSLKPIVKGMKIKLKLEKHMVVWVPVPCTEKEKGHFFGSCEYPVDELIEKLKAELEEKKLGDSGFKCGPPYLPEGQKCELPLKPGQYGSEDESTAIKITVPKLPPLAKSFIDGKLKVKGELIDENGKSVVCLNGEITLTSK